MGKFINEETRKSLTLLARVSTMGLSFALSIVIGLAAGFYIDKWLDCAPWGFFIGMGMGIVAGFRNMYIIAKRSQLL